jgi:hypothetical protein
VTLAWTEDHYGRAPSVGDNANASTVRSATARVGGPVSAAREVAAHRTYHLSTPAVAAAGGRVVLAWGLDAIRHEFGVQAAIGPAGRPGPPQTVVAERQQRDYYRSPAAITVALDPDGAATVLYEEPVEGATGRSGRGSWRPSVRWLIPRSPYGRAGPIHALRGAGSPPGCHPTRPGNQPASPPPCGEGGWGRSRPAHRRARRPRNQPSSAPRGRAGTRRLRPGGRGRRARPRPSPSAARRAGGGPRRTRGVRSRARPGRRRRGRRR